MTHDSGNFLNQGLMTQAISLTSDSLTQAISLTSDSLTRGKSHLQSSQFDSILLDIFGAAQAPHIFAPIIMFTNSH